MKQTITVLDIEGNPHPGVEADVIHGIAVHLDAFGGNFYSITHVKSGARFKRSTTRSDALAMRRRLNSIQIGGVRLGNLPGCELCANAMLITELAQINLDQEETNHAAEILCQKGSAI